MFLLFRVAHNYLVFMRYRNYTTAVFDGRKQTVHTVRVAQLQGEQPKTWAERYVGEVGRAMKDARGTKSAAWLSERTEQLGCRVSRSVIAKLDSGHRGDVLSVVELCVIAAALEVPPVALLFPDLPDGEIEMPPRHHSASEDAMRWFCGESGTIPFGALIGEVDHSDLAPNDAAQLVEAVRRRRGLLRQAAEANASPDIRAQVPALLDEIRSLAGRIRALGGVIDENRWAIDHEIGSSAADA